MIFAHLHDALNAFAKFDKQSGTTPAAAIGPGQLPH
jgi:hypothetical protein